MIKISEMKRGQNIQGCYLIKDVLVRNDRNGRDYLHLTLSDRTGEIDAMLWGSTPEQHEQFTKGTIVGVKGGVQEWQGKLQVRIEEIWKDSNLSLEEFLQGPPKEVEMLWMEVMAHVDEVEDNQLRNVLTAILEDYKKEFMMWPAAKGMHHAFRGGLLYHVATMLQMADRVLDVYPFLNRDLLYSGVVLHDIGKILEMDADQFGIVHDYTTEGNLLGHIIQGIRLVDRYALRYGLDEETNMLLQHMILSHHYNPEWGSPKPPMIPEAEILHFLDMVDSRMFAIWDALSKVANGRFTQPIRSLGGRKMYISTAEMDRGLNKVAELL